VKASQIPQKKSVLQRFEEADMMLSKLVFQPDVDAEKKKEERQRSEPAADVKNSHICGATEGRSLPNQDLTDKKPAQNEKQFDSIETEVAENSEDTDQVWIKHDEAVGTDHADYCRSPEKIETEDTLIR